MNQLCVRSLAICLVLTGCGSILAQNSNPTQKGSTKFGLPVAKSDNTAPVGSTAAAVENRSNTLNAASASATKTSEVDAKTNWGAVAKIFVGIEGSRQGKFKGTARRGPEPQFECLSYVLQPQSGGGQKPSIVISKVLDGATSQFLQALQTGEPLKTVVLEFVLEGVPGKPVSKVTLTGASIVAIQQHFDARTRGVFEDITLNFTKIDYTE